jgi:hypothetical protein
VELSKTILACRLLGLLFDFIRPLIINDRRAVLRTLCPTQQGIRRSQAGLDCAVNTNVPTRKDFQYTLQESVR